MVDPRRSSVTTTNAMQALLDFEDAAPEELLEILPGSTVPFWAQIRMQIAWALSEASTGSVAVASGTTWTRWGEAKRLATAFIPNRWDARLRARPHDVLFFVGGGTLTPVANRARNWLVEDFANATNRATIVQRRPLPTPLGQPTYASTSSMESATARSRLWARSFTPSDDTVGAVDRLLGFYAANLGLSDSVVAGLRSRVMRTEAHRPHELAELRRIVARVRPRVVIMDTASYTYNGESVGVFKDAGAYVAEPQHGWIGPSHAAYNYGRVATHPSFLRALPDELLTFGEYWSDSVRMPIPTTAIGKPHLEARASVASHERPAQILIISSRAEPERTDAFVRELRSLVDARWSVAFRPHPAEREVVEARYPGISQDPGVSIDSEPDVYDSLAQTRLVVGVASTVLFEAAAFGCTVIARDNPFASSVIGETFGSRAATASDVANRIASLDASSSTAVTPDPDLWAPNAIESYRSWLADHLARRAP